MIPAWALGPIFAVGAAVGLIYAMVRAKRIAENMVAEAARKAREVRSGREQAAVEAAARLVPVAVLDWTRCWPVTAVAGTASHPPIERVDVEALIDFVRCEFGSDTVFREVARERSDDGGGDHLSVEG